MIAPGTQADARCCFCGGRTQARYRMGPYAIRQCARCGTGSVRPMPSPDELRAFYNGFLAHLNVRMMPRIRSAVARLLPRLGLARGRGLRMLDIGGGGGFYAKAFEQFGINRCTLCPGVALEGYQEA